MIQTNPAKTNNIPEPASDQLRGYQNARIVFWIIWISLGICPTLLAAMPSEPIGGLYRKVVIGIGPRYKEDQSTRDQTNKLETDVTWKLTWQVLAFVLSCLTLRWNFSRSFIGFEDCPIQLRQRTEPPHKLHDRTPPLAGPTAAFSCRHDSPKTFFVCAKVGWGLEVQN